MVQLSELLTRLPTPEQGRSRWISDGASYLLHYSDVLSTNPPDKLLGVVAWPWRRQGPDRWSRFLAIGRYRVAYSLIEGLASHLASAVLQTGVVPLIVPIRDRSLLGMTLDTPLIRQTIETGVRLFQRTGHR